MDFTSREAPSTSNLDTSQVDERGSNGLSTFGVRVMPNQEFNSNFLERDLGKHIPIWQYLVDQRDEIRRAYIRLGPYQVYLAQYPFSNNENHHRRFQHCWFAQFSSWLEYSPTKDAAYCLPCYLFASKVNPKFGANAFTVEGFENWKKVSNRKRCAFLSHMGDHSSPHSLALRSCDDLMSQYRHIDNVMKTRSEEQILNNRLRLKTSIECVRWLAFQSCPFRGHDEGPTSRNRGNFLQLVNLMAIGNEEIKANVLENAPYFAKCTCPKIEKEILSIIASKVRHKIREDIGDLKFGNLVDEA